MAALNSTVASVPAREHVFDVTSANTRAGRKGCESGVAKIKVFGAYYRGVLKENRKLLPGFEQDNKLVFLNIFLASPNLVCPTPSKVPTTVRDKHVRKMPSQKMPIANWFAAIMSQPRVRKSPHSAQVRTKPEEKGQY